MRKLDVATDSTLAAAEKETTIRTANDEESLHVASEQTAVVRWLRDHPEFEERGRRVVDDTLVAIRGTLPRGCLKLQASPRKDSTPSAMLSRLPSKDG